MARGVAAVGVLVGVVLRIVEATQAQVTPDGVIYVELARRFSFADPWHASFREPLWIAALKVLCWPFGYEPSTVQTMTTLLACAGLVVAAVVLWVLTPRWVAVPGVTLLAVDPRLIAEAGGGSREVVGLLAVGVALWCAARSPGWLPVVAAVTLDVRWELGVALVVAALVCRVGWRPWLTAAAVGVVLMAPFLVNNARAFHDPMFHSNVHAIYSRNVDVHGWEPLTRRIPVEDRFHDLLYQPRWRGPQVTWARYALNLGAGEVERREAEAWATIPVEVLTFGRLPRPVGWLLAGAAVVGVWQGRRSRVVTAAAVVVAVAVIGYGLTIPSLDLRLVGYLTLPLLVLASRAADQRDLESTVREGARPAR